MAKTKGDRLKHKEVKVGIIEFILKNSESVSEPAIRDHLKEKYGIMDQSTINKHLHALQDLTCIEQISHKPGLRNYWDIKNIKNLNNIKHEFPELRLNRYEKSIDLIMHHFGRHIMGPDGLKLYIQLLLSPSLFNICIDTDIETLDEGVWGIYINWNGSCRHQHIEDLLKICYTACVKHYSSFQMSEKAFIGMMNGFPFEHVGIFDKATILKMFETNLPGLPEEIPLKIFETKLLRKERLAEGITEEVLKKIQIELLEEIPEKIPEEINNKDLIKYILNTMRLLREESQDFSSTRDSILLEHCLKNDMLLGAGSEEEIAFMKKTKDTMFLANNYAYRKIKTDDLKLASKIIFNYKQPSKFVEGSNDPDEIYKNLLKYYGTLVVGK